MRICPLANSSYTTPGAGQDRDSPVAEHWARPTSWKAVLSLLPVRVWALLELSVESLCAYSQPVCCVGSRTWGRKVFLPRAQA
jgi:hypothetical protein